MTHSPDHAERAGVVAGAAYLMTGSWELDPAGTSPGIYVNDPAGGDPICLCTIKRLYHPDLLRASLQNDEGKGG